MFAVGLFSRCIFCCNGVTLSAVDKTFLDLIVVIIILLLLLFLSLLLSFVTSLILMQYTINYSVVFF